MHTLSPLPMAFDDCKLLPECEGAGAAHSLLSFAKSGPRDHPGHGQVRPSHPVPNRCAGTTLPRLGHRAEPPGCRGVWVPPVGQVRVEEGGNGPGAQVGPGRGLRPPLPPALPAPLGLHTAPAAPAGGRSPPVGRAQSQGVACPAVASPAGGAAGGARLSPGPVLCPLPPFPLLPSLPSPRPRAARPPAPPAAGAAPYGPHRCHEPGPGSPRR